MEVWSKISNRLVWPKLSRARPARRRDTEKELRPFLRSLTPLFRVVFFILLSIHIAAILILLFEGQSNKAHFDSFADALWWAIVTMTTVGYGDKYPTTSGGRVVAGFLMYSSIILVSFFTATISAIAVGRKIQEGKGLEAVKLVVSLICLDRKNDRAYHYI